MGKRTRANISQWGNYIYSFEPPSGTGYTYYNSLLKTYAPGV